MHAQSRDQLHSTLTTWCRLRVSLRSTRRSPQRSVFVIVGGLASFARSDDHDVAAALDFRVCPFAVRRTTRVVSKAPSKRSSPPRERLAAHGA